MRNSLPAIRQARFLPLCLTHDFTRFRGGVPAISTACSHPGIHSPRMRDPRCMDAFALRVHEGEVHWDRQVTGHALPHSFFVPLALHSPPCHPSSCALVDARGRHPLCLLSPSVLIDHSHQILSLTREARTAAVVKASRPLRTICSLYSHNPARCSSTLSHPSHPQSLCWRHHNQTLQCFSSPP